MVTLVRKAISDLEEGHTPIELLAKTATLNKKFDQYRAKSSALQAAIQILDDAVDDEIEQGYQFSVVSIKKRNILIKTSKFPMLQKGTYLECTVRDISLIKDYSEVDVDKYKELIRNAFTPIFDPFDLEWDRVIEGDQGLDDFFDENGFKVDQACIETVDYFE